MENSNQLTKVDNARILEIIDKIPHLSDNDKKELSLKIASDDIEIRKMALEKMTNSQVAQHDLATIMGEIAALNKQGMYVKTRQTLKTGSGHMEIEMKGGDTKLIIPVLIIVAIAVIAALVIVFWN